MSNKYSLYAHQSPSGKLYIGITSRNPYIRWGHNGQGYFDKRKSNQSHFYNAIQKYGWDNFNHIILLENLSKEVACECEKYLIEKYKTDNENYGYNLTQGGDGIRNYHHTPETKKLLSQKLSGRTLPQEVKDKISKSHRGIPNKGQKGKKVSPEILAKRSASLKGHIVTEETREKIRIANTGRHPSEEARKKMSLNNAMHNPEVVEKMKQSLKQSTETRVAKRKATMQQRYPDGWKQSNEARRKCSEALKGRPKSEETKQKMRKPKSPQAIENMRKAQKEAWKRRKARMGGN